VVAGVILLVVAVGAFVTAVVGRPSANALKPAVSPVFAVPGSVDVPLGSGTWVVAWASPSGHTAQPAVSVAAPPGASVSVVSAVVPSTYTESGITYQAVVQFTVTQPGDYRVTVTGALGWAVVARSVFDQLFSVLPWVALGTAATLCGLLGVVLLVVGLVQRRRARQPLWVNAPAGWSGRR
jgi:hypothetical protein